MAFGILQELHDGSYHDLFSQGPMSASLRVSDKGSMNVP